MTELTKCSAKMAVIILLLLLCSTARADQIATISGVLTGIPGETLTYNLTVQTTIESGFGGFVLDDMSGIVSLTDATGFTSTNNFGNDLYAFGLNESAILAEFGIYSGTPPILTTGYDFMGSATGVSIVFVDPPAPNAAARTPEPQTWFLILTGIALLIAFFPPRRKEYQRRLG